MKISFARRSVRLLRAVATLLRRRLRGRVLRSGRRPRPGPSSQRTRDAAASPLARR